MYWAGDRFECLVGGFDKMSVVDDALEQAASSVTYWIVVPLIVAFLIGVVMSWMS